MNKSFIVSSTAAVVMEVTGLIFYFFYAVLFEITICTLDVSIRVSKQDPFTYGNFHKRINGSVLNKSDSLISALEVDNDIECASFCVMNKLCLSVNFGPQVNKSRKVQCELLNHGATDYHNYLVKKEKFFFMRMENICSKNPCVNDTLVCKPQLQNAYQPYFCDCPGNCTGVKCHALGMEDRRIRDSQITASNVYSKNFARNGRLNNAVGSWLTIIQVPQWLQVNMLNKTFIKGVATQGRHYRNNFVRTYQLLYSDDGTNWTTYKEKGIVKTFQGNTHHQGVVKNLLAEPFTAKFVRLLAISSNGHCSVRMELYGCPVESGDG